MPFNGQYASSRFSPPLVEKLWVHLGVNLLDKEGDGRLRHRVQGLEVDAYPVFGKNQVVCVAKNGLAGGEYGMITARNIMNLREYLPVSALYQARTGWVPTHRRGLWRSVVKALLHPKYLKLLVSDIVICRR